MYYLYLLKSEKSSKAYIGVTTDLKRRFHEHNKGLSAATKVGTPWKLIYYEAFLTKKLALQREYKLKRYGRGLVELKNRTGF